MSRFIHRRLHPVRTSVFFVLTISLLLPHPSVIAAQEAPETGTEANVTSSPEATTSEASVPVDDVTDQISSTESIGSTDEAEVEGAINEEGAEPQMSGFSEEEVPDPFYGDDREPRARQPVLEPDPLDGSLRYVYSLIAPPGRNGMEPNLSLIYSWP